MYEEEIVIFPEQSKNSAFEILMCGRSFCDGTYRINRPNSPLWCFEYICKGTGTVQVDHVRFAASKGDVYILPAGTDHYYYSDDRDPWEKVWFNIRGSFVGSTMKAYNLENLYHIRSLNLRPLFEDFISHAYEAKNASPDPLRFDTCAVDFLKVVQGIASAPNLQEKHLSTSKVQQFKYRLDTMTDFTQSFDELIGDYFYTKSHLIRTFKAEYGITPYNYLLERKLNTAKLLLNNTAISITEIAQRLGFANCHYFSAFFTKRTGLSPREFRKIGPKHP